MCCVSDQPICNCILFVDSGYHLLTFNSSTDNFTYNEYFVGHLMFSKGSLYSFLSGLVSSSDIEEVSGSYISYLFVGWRRPSFLMQCSEYVYANITKVLSCSFTGISDIAQPGGCSIYF